MSCARRSSTNSSIGRVEWPMVQRRGTCLPSVRMGCLFGPLDELFRVLDDVHRYFVIGLERLLGIRPERLHPLLHVSRPGPVVGFKVQPALVDDGEEDLALVYPVAAEHRAGGDSW